MLGRVAFTNWIKLYSLLLTDRTDKNTVLRGVEIFQFCDCWKRHKTFDREKLDNFLKKYDARQKLPKICSRKVNESLAYFSQMANWFKDHTSLDCLTILWQMWTIAQPLNGWGQRSRVFKLTTSENERSFPFLLCVVCSRPVLANLNLQCRFAGRKWCAVYILKIAVWALCKCASGH